MITEAQQKLIDEVMDEFNFDRVHRTMMFLDWKWGMPGTVPSIGDLRRAARARMQECIEKNWHSIESGGLRAEYDPETKDWIRLNFVLADWTAGGE